MSEEEISPLDSQPSPPPPTGVMRVLTILLPILICMGGIAVSAVLIATKPEAERTVPEVRGLPVRTAVLQPGTHSVQVRAHGQVIAARQVIVQPELNGRVTAMNPELVPGGRVAAGDTLIRIDRRNYRSAVEQQRAQVETNRVQLSQENSRRLIAEREWALLRQERGAASAEGRDLALREPQSRQAQAGLRAAESSLRQAQTNLNRTTVIAPFDAFVQSETVELGQLVGPTSMLATLVGTEHFWVRVAIPMEELEWVRLPRGEQPGSQASVTQRVGEHREVLREGRVIRLLGDLDPVGRMARVLVEIDDPFGLEQTDREGSDLPILLGAFVNVSIDAGELHDVYEVPRDALHANDTVHLYSPEDRLEVRQINVRWRRDASVLVTGLEPGTRLVLSQVSSAIDGTLLREAEEETSEAEGDDDSENDGADDET